MVNELCKASPSVHRCVYLFFQKMLENIWSRFISVLIVKERD